jgi:hypothetical protein
MVKKAKNQKRRLEVISISFADGDTLQSKAKLAKAIELLLKDGRSDDHNNDVEVEDIEKEHKSEAIPNQA